MKQTRRFVSALVLLAMLLPMLFGCGEAPAVQTDPKVTEPTDPPAPTEEYFEPIPDGYNQVTFYWSLKFSSVLERIPNRSTITRFLTPRFKRCLPIAIPADPAPFMTTRTLPISFFTSLSALINAAPTTIAVPC